MGSAHSQVQTVPVHEETTLLSLEPPPEPVDISGLQAELEAANRESECVRLKLRAQAEEMEKLKRACDDQTEEWIRKYQELEAVHTETEDKLKSTQQLSTTLQIQIANVKSETEKCQLEKQKLMQEKQEEQKVLRDALDKALKERTELETKFKRDFEQVRNVNCEREERLMEDCEWKIRSMQKQCKEKLEVADKERFEAVKKMTDIEAEWTRHSTEISNISSYEAELKQLRGLTSDQHESIQSLRKQIDDLRAELTAATKKLEDEIENCKEIKKRCEYDLAEKERQALARIEAASGDIAVQWEDKLLEEMARMKMELEQIGLEERQNALNELQKEYEQEITKLKSDFSSKQSELVREINNLKDLLAKKHTEYEKLQTKSDHQVVEARMHAQKVERDSQILLDKELAKRDEIIENLKQQFHNEKTEMENSFKTRLEHVQEEFARELNDATEIMKAQHKRELEEQWTKLVHEKEEALQAMELRYRRKIEDVETNLKEMMLQQERSLKDLKDAHDMERGSLEKRDAKNVQEIDTLHKKCRCLTKLFEEMRMRYERRDPRPEDLRQITELKSIVEAQDRDLRILTERFREMQMYQQHQMQQALPPYPQVVGQQVPPRKSKSRTPQKNGQPMNGHTLPPPPAAPSMMMTPDQMMKSHLMPVCEVIYEENEDQIEQQQQHQNGFTETNGTTEHRAIVHDIINDMVASVNAQANGLSESAF